MLGMLEIQRLRDEAQQKLGPTFDIKAFHDRVLEDGGVPLAFLDSEDSGLDRRFFLIASQPSSRRLISFSNPRSVGW